MGMLGDGLTGASRAPPSSSILVLGLGWSSRINN
jgi:hypothetical protein